jgi:dihydropteroate synthase
MHKQGDPATMQQAPRYDDVLAEVSGFLRSRLECSMQAGIARDRIVVDPGFGFGKTIAHNLTLTKGLQSMKALGVPILVGWSRKSSLGKLVGRPEGERLSASLAMALLCLQRGARILRVHDVRETRDVVRIWEALESA